MPQITRTGRFKQAVLRMELDRDEKALVQLFSEQATLETPAHHSPLTGRDGAAEFWKDYLDTFQSIRSHFTREHILGDTAVFEWRSAGTLTSGRSIEYRGASIVRFTGEQIEGFTAYFDSAAFLAEPVVAADISHGTNNEGGD